MLFIYRASAGSGKTFLLTRFYIELLFKRELTPSLEAGRDLSFSEILAVTFTNKATAEMKERIVRELKKLWENPQASDYYKCLKKPDSKGIVMSDEEIQNRAHGILKGMLTDYSNVHISTIDKFFQQVVRSFAHELNQQSDYAVELDTDSVLDHAVTQFLLNLDTDKDRETFDWLLRFSNKRLQDGAKWDVHDSLFTLAKVLTTEDYRIYSESIAKFTADKKAMADYAEMLNQIVRQWTSDLRRIGKSCTRIMSDCDLTVDDFSYKTSSFASNFAFWTAGKEKNSRLTGAADDPTKWFPKKDQHKLAQMGSRVAEMQGLLQEAINLLDGERYAEYVSAKLLQANIYQLGLLEKLEKAADQYCAEQGIKLLNNTTQMLNALVCGQSSPFVYEKTGTRIASYMIDEFQDTSGMQWQNFAPLLSDSLGNGNRNLIVGDVKQSIYRFRGSNWELLHSHINNFERQKQQKKDDDGNDLQLLDNWRSDRKIIEFNNAFFKYLSETLCAMGGDNPEYEKIREVYADVAQKIAVEREAKGVQTGRVAFEILSDEDEDEASAKTSKASYNALVAKRLPEIVVALQQQGRRPKDIIVLCRTNSECGICAAALMDYAAKHPDSPYPMAIITEEALQLGRHPVVRALVAALEFLHDPKSDHRAAVAAICWRSLSSTSMSDAIAGHFAAPSMPDFTSLLNLPLYETVERLIAMLPDSARDQSNFIQAFCDVVLDFCTSDAPSLDRFLTWWHEKGFKCSVTTPTEQDAISIMTIHKSKGLAGDAVIVPFADILLDIDLQKPPTIWCRPNAEPFCRENLAIPIKANLKMQKSIFADDFAAERVRNIIDSLNNVYVAFTRARHELILLAPQPPKDSNGTSMKLEKFLNNFFNGDAWKGGNDAASLVIDERMLADRQASDTTDIAATANDSHFICPEVHLPVIKQTTYVAPSDSAAARGTTLHAAFSAIIDRDHVDEPITRMFESGKAQLQGFTLDDVLQHIHNALGCDEARTWFDPQNRTLNEQDIITQSTHTQRPDRIVLTPDGRTIVIDYKTGEERNTRYRKQVGHYVKLLREMGFPQVEGHIWYVESGEIVPVTA
ncbi:MAG: UvrD-helicase domain-containing protein [Bacteroidales bacterium]|nr:UvrD-helicase domain-containing protein [Bacteroidales bacterium]